MSGSDIGIDSGDGDCIKVFVRIRPPGSYDADIGQVQALNVLDEKSLAMNCKPDNKVFTFDKVADINSTQESLFDVIGKPILECCISGYNGTIFAYGQTGSGKTHTMLGPCEDGDHFQHELRGIIPRSFENLFNHVARELDMNKEKEFLLKCSFLEIYREDVFDLLEPSNRGLHLRENMKKGVFVEGLVETAVTSAAEAYQVLNAGYINRRVASTSMNRESSRSHAVFTVTIESKEKKDGLKNLRSSQLNLVDLAGSERQKDTNSVGQRLKEAGSINRSLSILGNVINSLVHISHGKKRHIPYRDSKLTFLLRDSLGGNAKTHIIACVHPSSKCFGETLSTLQFARRAKMIKNKAVINEDSQGNVIALQLEIKKLKEMLQQYVSGSIKIEPTMSENEKDETTEKSTLSDSEWKERFIQAMLLRESCANEKIIIKDRLEKLTDQCNKKDVCVRSTKMVVKFRENRISQLETSLKKNGLQPDDKDKYAEDLKSEIKLLQEQVNQHPMVAKYAMEIQSLKSELKQMKEQKNNVISSRDRLHELERNYKELIQENKPFTPSQTPKDENVATATIEKYKSQVNNLQEEIAKLKQQLTETSDSAEKEKVVFNSEIESLKLTVKDLTTTLNTQKLTNKIERETMNDIHLQTITQITTPKKAKYHLRNRVILSSASTSNTPSLDDSIQFENNEDIFKESQPDQMMEQAQQALMDEMKVLQSKNNSLTERISEFEAEAIKLRQHISKVDHQNAQLNEILSREKAELTSKAELSDKQFIELQKQLQEAQEEARMKREEARDLNIMMTSHDKQLKDIKNELKIKTDDFQKNYNQLETKVVQIEAELDNVSKELETALEEKDSLQDELDTILVETKFKDDMISELEETVKSEKNKIADLERENLVLTQESQNERSSLSEQLRNEERQNEANSQTIVNLQRELQTADQTVSEQEKQLTESKEAINNYLTKLKDLKSCLFDKTFTLDAELEKNKGLEESLHSMVNEISSLRNKTVEMGEEKMKIELDHQAELYNVNKELECLTENFNVLEKEHRKTQRSHSELEEKVESLEKEKGSLVTQMNESKGTFEKERLDLKQKIGEAEKRLISKESENEEVFGKLIDELTEKNERLKENNSDLCKSIKELQDSKDEKNKENEELRNKLKVIETITEESSQLRNMKQCLEYEMQSKDESLDKLMAASLVKDELIDSLSKDITKIKEESSSISAEIEILKLKNEVMEKEVNEINERNKVLLEENSKLIGHQNHKQKIHYTEKLKDENNFLREQLSKYQQELLKIKKGTPSKKENRSPFKHWNDFEESL